ncbi:MAG: ATP-binding protein [Nanoarchaeota archaeon]|nr:ATP-binding protein [Nanoarchaeota archaeon]
MTRKYLLTGAPGSGKSSLILELEWFGKYIIREAAEDWINLQKARGIEDPRILPDFQEKILELQQIREKKIPSYTHHIFIDRSYADGLAYAKPESTTANTIRKFMETTHYDEVFLIERLTTHKQTAVRTETKQKAEMLEELIEKGYKKLGYNPIRVAPGTTKERAEFILQYCYEPKKQTVRCLT